VNENAVAAILWVDSRCTLGEGIIWSERCGALLWSDIQSFRLWRYAQYNDVVHSWVLPDRLGALAECESGKLLLGFTKQLSMTTLHDEHQSGILDITPVASVEAAQASTRVNDGRTDRAGNFVFGTLNEHRDKRPIGNFYQFSIQHGLRRLELPSIVIPNSICFSPGGQTMYFCDSLERKIMSCDYRADEAKVANVHELVRFAPYQGLPDGSVVDADGCLWNAEWGSAMVRRYSPSGRIDREIAIPAKNPTCVAFGGSRLDELYVTSSRLEMSPEELERTPHAGGVYRVIPGVTGIRDRKFKDT
jgi:sugar lactone lactonase YvrE